MEARLRRLGPNAMIKILRIPEDSGTRIWLFGRGTTCQIYTRSKFASRQHFSITYREQKYFISDLQSANGTFLNDEKLADEKVLTPGTIISVGVPSQMQNSPDCVVYIFELNCPPLLSDIPAKDMKKNVLKVKSNSVTSTTPKVQTTATDTWQKQPKEEFCNESVDVEMRVDDIEITSLNDSSSNDVILIEPSPSPERPSLEALSKPKPPKIRKLDVDSFVSHKNEKNAEEKSNNVCPEEEEEEEDVMAYNAPTQTDEDQVKTEPDLLNYSQTEELIELSDSDDDWSPGLKLEGNKSPEALDGYDDEDDDIIILETRITAKDGKKDELAPVIVVEDDMTDVDKKWLGRLLKIKKEEIFKGSQEVPENVESGEQVHEAGETDMVLDEIDIVKEQVENSSEADRFTIIPHSVTLDTLLTNDIPEEMPEAAPEIFPRVEVPKKIIKRVEQKKMVSFDMVPQIRYFEVPTRSRLTASEKGRLRFSRIIFNICNWNTHWLEECKRVAPDKVPNDLCEERLRKIPKKFVNHGDYMVSFIPPMLLELWNKIKDKWVASGESGFRQTLSCDSCEDHHAENLSVYKCTGLVQSVSAHKHLLREGHLVLLRLHQVQVPEFTTPAAEKYSKKLGYLVFGFVKSKIYERYHNQTLHRGLAERCASVVGDLHITRLTILVKKRPSFQIDKQKLIQLTVVQHISHEIKMFRAICLLPDSPLCTAVLKPTKTEVPLQEPPKTDLIFKGPIDEFQSEVVRKLSQACSSKKSLLYSIHGAAGTGKSQLICALILQFLYGTEWRSKRPKIIYCTQWSIPLDETVTKLKALRQTLEEPFKLVRVGPVREVKPLLRDLCVSYLASNIQNSDKRVFDLRNFDAEIKVIKEADVLCMTCTSAGTAKMCAAFEKLLIRDRDRKVICIIDEAMSCRETNSVIPLLLGVTHLILVGDLYQMEPPFSGEKTHSLGLDMPLFWRIYKNFMNIPKELWPITELKTQYRMNSSLSDLTSELFYKTLPQIPSEGVQRKVRILRSHLLLLDQTPESVTKEEKENREVRIVSQIIKAVVRLSKSSLTNCARFGVIMRDIKQIESLQAVLPKRAYPEVEIDQIQSFQGKELDVIIYVCDGRKIVTSWLVTALTRARKSLLIFASQKSIAGNSLFRQITGKAEKDSFLKFVHPDMTSSQLEELLVLNNP